MIGELYAAAEADEERPKFARVLEDAKKALSPGSSHSKFSFFGEDVVCQVSLSNQQYRVFHNVEADIKWIPSE